MSNNDIVLVAIELLSANISAIVTLIGDILRVSCEVRVGRLVKEGALKYCQDSSI
jgi:hypothetical protein